MKREYRGKEQRPGLARVGTAPNRGSRVGGPAANSLPRLAIDAGVGQARAAVLKIVLAPSMREVIVKQFDDCAAMQRDKWYRGGQQLVFDLVENSLRFAMDLLALPHPYDGLEGEQKT